MRYFKHTAASLDFMLKAVNKNSLDDLFVSIPADSRLNKDLDLPAGLDELAMKRALAPFSSSQGPLNFLGAGATEHFVPEWISQQLLRAEWYTSYTPYQPELSQGTLQAIFEFQSMVASLLGLEVANASMYDGATALVEALLMAVRITGRKAVALSSAIHPEYRECVRTYLSLADIDVVEFGFGPSGQSEAPADANSCAAIALQSPNFFGVIENIKAFADIAHRHGALLLGCTTDMSATSVIASWGHQGADIAVGEGLGLLSAINLGGPGLGLLAAKKAYLRQLPGRLVGQGTDKHGNVGYVLTLAAREQHIRREKATSNICTNHNLMALAFAMTLSAYGRRGFYELGQNNMYKTWAFRSQLKNLGVRCTFSGPHYNETVVDLKDESRLEKRVARALEHNIIAGLSLSRFYPDLAGHLLVATTELHDDEQLKLLSHILGGSHD